MRVEARMRKVSRPAATGGALVLAAAALVVANGPGFSARAEAQAARPPATFTKDVAPILQRSCQNCHRPGSIGPMSLLTYEDVRPWVRSMKTRVSGRQMPPWHIDRNAGTLHSFKNDPSLSDAEINTIVSWIDGGTPRGNAADMPPPRM